MHKKLSEFGSYCIGFGDCQLQVKININCISYLFLWESLIICSPQINWDLNRELMKIAIPIGISRRELFQQY